MTTAEERTWNAIQITRRILRKALDSPFTLAVMTAEDLDPDHVEDEVERILYYLEKTKNKQVQSKWAKGLPKGYICDESGLYAIKEDEKSK